MKTKAIEFSGACSLNWCNSHNDTEGRGGVEVLIEAHGTLAGEEDMGEMVCLDCASRLARLLKKRVRQCREKQAQGLEYRGDESGEMRWRKRKATSKGAKL